MLKGFQTFVYCDEEDEEEEEENFSPQGELMYF
jgi:hypothetical protein